MGEGLEAAFSVTVLDHGAAPRGAHANRPLREGDPYLVVPWRLVLGPHSVAAGTALPGASRRSASGTGGTRSRRCC